MKTDVHNKDFFLRLVSKERLRGTQKWSTTMHHPVNSARREVHFILSKKDAPRGGTHVRSPATQEKQQLALRTADHYNETSNIHCVGFENTIHVDFPVSSSIVLSVMRSTRSSAGFLICCCCGNQKEFFYRCAPFLFMGVIDLR